MRKLSPAYVVTSVVIALVGGSAFAAPAGAVARPNNAGTVQSGVAPTTTGSSTARNAVVAPAPVTTSNSTATSQSSDSSGTFVNGNPAARNTTTTTTNANGTTTTTTNRGMTLSDGSRSGSNTDSSAANAAVGSSASTQPGANGSTTSSSSGTIDGSRAGTNIDSSASLTPLGTTSANGTLGAASVNSATGTTPLGTPGINAQASGGGLSPVIGAYGAVGANGEVMASGVDNGYAGAAVDQTQYNNGTIAAANAEAVRNSQSFDRAVNVVKRDRQRVGRNGQLLQSIAPRTNADRSREMPDDGPSPSLTGTNSALAR